MPPIPVVAANEARVLLGREAKQGRPAVNTSSTSGLVPTTQAARSQVVVELNQEPHVSRRGRETGMVERQGRVGEGRGGPDGVIGRGLHVTRTVPVTLLAVAHDQHVQLVAPGRPLCLGASLGGVLADAARATSGGPAYPAPPGGGAAGTAPPHRGVWARPVRREGAAPMRWPARRRAHDTPASPAPSYSVMQAPVARARARGAGLAH